MAARTFASGKSRAAKLGSSLTVASETVRRLLAFPPDTQLVFKSHDSSIAQRTALDQARQDKASGGSGQGSKMRETFGEELGIEKNKS